MQKNDCMMYQASPSHQTYKPQKNISMQWIIFCNIIIATVFNINKVVYGHEDLEGFCLVVLSEYPTAWGVDISSFIECVCEESHTGNGETLVVCQYAKNVGNETNSKPTGSCDAKFCLFTQECKVPPITNFKHLSWILRTWIFRYLINGV